jgi:hypothetical protein
LLNKEEKYSVIVLLMKNLIPLINVNDLRNSETALNNNFDNVRIKYHMKYMEDPVLKKVFTTNKNTMAQSIRRSLEKLPKLNKIKGKNNSMATIQENNTNMGLVIIK